MDLYKDLSPSEELEFRQWARSNWKVGEEVNEAWHPIVRDECSKIHLEYAKSVDEHIKRINEKVRTYMDDHWRDWVDARIYGSSDNREHIISIGTSILCTKWEVGYPGGSFAKAVASNDLMQSYGCADEVNKHCIGLYAQLLYNVAYVN